jgi:hypothetical protein
MVVAGFFILGGLLHFALALFQPGQSFWSLWEAAGRGLLSWVVAFGLVRRLAVFRSIAAVYCVVMLLTYLAVLGLAYAHTVANYPTPLIVESLYEIPSCTLLVPYLLSERAGEAFHRPLF